MSPPAPRLSRGARRQPSRGRDTPWSGVVGAVLLAVQVCGPSWCSVLVAAALPCWSVIRSRGARHDGWVAVALAMQAVLHLVTAIQVGQTGPAVVALHLGVAVTSVAVARVGGRTIATCCVGLMLCRWRAASTRVEVPGSTRLRARWTSTAPHATIAVAALGSRAPPVWVC